MKKKSSLRKYVKSIATAVFLALLVRQFAIQAFRIPSGSMENTILVGDFILAEKLTYGAKTPDRIPFTSVKIPSTRLPGIREPKQGDIIIFEYPNNPTKDFIKRVIATEGQTVEIRDKKVYVNGEKVPEPPEAKHVDPRVLPATVSTRDNFGPVKVPEDMYFVMGDNRDNSRDSRYWGWVPEENIEAKALIIYWSWNPNLPLWDITDKIRWGRIGDLVR